MFLSPFKVLPAQCGPQATSPVLTPTTSFTGSLQLEQNQSLCPEPASVLAAWCFCSHKNVPSCLSNFPFSLPTNWPVLQFYLQCSFGEASDAQIRVIPTSTEHPTPVLFLYNTNCSLPAWSPFLSSTLYIKLLEGDKWALLISESPCW